MLRNITISIFVLTNLFGQGSLPAQNWNMDVKLTSDFPKALDFAGISIDISGSWMVMGAWWDDMNDQGPVVDESGAAYLFQMDADKEWILRQKLFSSNPESLGYFGFSVAIDESVMVVGAYNEDQEAGTLKNTGAVYVYELEPGGSWLEVQKLVSPDAGQGDLFGYSVSLSGDRILVGAPKHKQDTAGQNEMPDAGAAYVFDRQGNDWNFSQKLVASDRNEEDEFGKFIDLSNDHIIIGAEDQDQGFQVDAGAAYIFEYDQSLDQWHEQQLFASDASAFKDFGWDVAIDGDYALVGASAEIQRPDGSSGANSGTVYAFRRDQQGSWLETQKIFAPDYAQNDFFGRSIDLQDEYAIIGADMEDEDGQGQQWVSGAGSAYVFRRENDEWRFEQKLIGTDRDVDDLFGSAVALDWPHIAVGASRADFDDGSTHEVDAGAGYIFSIDEMITPILENSSGSQYQVSPNPSTRFLRIKSDLDSPFKTSLYSATGRHLFNLPANAETHDLSSLTSGIYFIKISSANYQTTLSWIKY